MGIKSVTNGQWNCVSCPDYTRPYPGDQCLSDTCMSGQILKTDGECMVCGQGYAPSADGRTCLTVPTTPTTNQRKCGEFQFLDSNGFCYNCMSGAKATPDG